MLRKFKIPMLVILTILLVVCVVVNQNKLDNAFEFKGEVKMVERTDGFFTKDDYQNGIARLRIYLQINQLDADAWMMLGECYEENGETVRALECYRKVAFLKEREESHQLELSQSSPTKLITESIEEPYVEISVDVKYVNGMKLQVSGKNLSPEKRYYGTVVGAWKDLQESDSGKKTTDWFSVDAAGGKLSLTGDFNQAVWQFKDATGVIQEAITVTAMTFRDKESVSWRNSSYAVVDIPENAVAARVTYWNDELAESTGTSKDDIYINYGLHPEALSAREVREYVLPDLDEGELITYSQGVWQLHRNTGETEVLSQLDMLELKKGDTLSISGNLCGIVTISKENEQVTVVTDGEYGIRWKKDEQSPVFERVGDAADLQFNYQTAEGEWAYPIGENDFDNIYPWSEIRLCAINATGKVTYSDETQFATDGSCGDVMVEIPVHYFKREIVDGYEYIWISATEREGYQVDPTFITENGVQEHVYVAAYLNSVENDSILSSKSDTYVALNIKGNELTTLSKAKGTGWASFDMVTLQTIQRLFMVETGIRNSQMLFMGNVSYNYGSTTDRASEDSAFAVAGDGSKRNVIELVNSNRNRRFEVGDAITIINIEPDDDQIHNAIGNNYENSNKWTHTILSITATDKNTLLFEFSGPSVEIINQESMMMNLPPENGKTNGIAYHTGETDGITGKRSFKYRYMENLWGTASVLLDGATIFNQVVTINYPDGRDSQLSYLIPVQAKTTAVSGPATGDISTIYDIGLDPANAAIMLPDSVGGGAIATDGFGDSLFYKADATEFSNIFAYGGAWDINLYAGLFNYRMNSYAHSDVFEFSGRLIYRESDIN